METMEVTRQCWGCTRNGRQQNTAKEDPKLTDGKSWGDTLTYDLIRGTGVL